MKRFVVLATLAVAGCQNGGIGLAESPAWFMSTTPEQQAAYFSKRCATYGVKPDTQEMTRCIMEEARSSRGNARRNWSSASDAMIQSSQQQRPITTDCNSFGNRTSCTTY